MKKFALKRLIYGTLVAFGVATLASCSDDTERANGTGETFFEITDAPSDDENIEGVFVTIAEIKVDGKTVEGFSKQTVDLKAYQEGSTKLLSSTTLAAKTYSNITLVLDLNEDQYGNAPGCYVLTHDGQKVKVRENATGTLAVAVNKSWKVASNSKTHVVVDFDLRKSIRYSESTEQQYSFVEDEKLKTAVRVVTRENSGTITGTFESDNENDGELVIVYAYKKGSFNSSAEVNNENDIMFRNAVASAAVHSTLTGKSYTLAFLPEGDYELHFVKYEKNNSGRLTFSSELESETSVDGNVGNIIKVKAGLSINVSSTVKGVI